MKRQNVLTAAMVKNIKDWNLSKDVIDLIVRGAVHAAFDKKLLTEAELHKMIEDAIASYKK